MHCTAVPRTSQGFQAFIRHNENQKRTSCHGPTVGSTSNLSLTDITIQCDLDLADIGRTRMKILLVTPSVGRISIALERLGGSVVRHRFLERGGNHSLDEKNIPRNGFCTL
jgi:hypothetical protein